MATSRLGRQLGRQPRLNVQSLHPMVPHGPPCCRSLLQSTDWVTSQTLIASEHFGGCLARYVMCLRSAFHISPQPRLSSQLDTASHRSRPTLLGIGHDGFQCCHADPLVLNAARNEQIVLQGRAPHGRCNRSSASTRILAAELCSGVMTGQVMGFIHQPCIQFLCNCITRSMYMERHVKPTTEDEQTGRAQGDRV